MGIRDDVRRLKQLTHKERTEDELVESFLGHLDYVLGHADEDHPSSEKFVNEGEFWRIN